MGRRGCERDLFVLRDSSQTSIAGRHRSLHTKSDVMLKRNASHPFGDAIAIKSPQPMKELWRKKNLLGLHNKKTIIKYCRGRCPHRPVDSGTAMSVFPDRSGDAPRGAMQASLLRKVCVRFCVRKSGYFRFSLLYMHFTR